MAETQDIKDSVLASVKKVIGVAPEDVSFDQELLIHINSVISILMQLGVCSEGSVVTDEFTTWDDLLSESPARGFIEFVKSYVALKVRSIFDPPSSSFVLDSLGRQIAELEWRLNCAVDPEPKAEEKEV